MRKLLFSSLTLLSCSVAIASNNQPNIIVILTDDQGSADLSCLGSTRVKTPNIDNMAAEGMLLNRFYTASSVSSPSRASILTGRMPQRVGVPAVLFPFTTTGLPSEEITIAEMLRDQGYATTIIGKWHLGHKPDQLPTTQGFDSFYGIPYSNDMSIAKELKISDDIVYNDGYDEARLQDDISKYEIFEEYKKIKKRVPLMRGDEVIEFPAEQTTLTERYTTEAVRYIQEHKEEPFFLYMAHTFPHEPIFVGEKFEGHSGNGLYCDAVEEIDWSVGEVLKAVNDNGLEENTFIIYLSDNGPQPLTPKGERKGSAGDLRGYKFDTYEGGYRSPCVIWYPQMIRAGRYSEEIVSALDIFPTIMNLVDAPMPDDRIYDGYDLAPYLSGEQSKSPRNEIYYYHANMMEIDGVRIGDWKYFDYGNLKDLKSGTSEKGHLHNLSVDISESDNLIERYPQKSNELQYQMKRFDRELNADIEK